MNLSPITSQPHPAVRWLALASWVFVALAYLTFFVLDLSLDYAQLLVPCAGESCNFLALSPTEIALLSERGWSSRAYASGMLGTTLLSVSASCLLAGLIFWRQGRSLIGWSVSLALVIIPITLISDANNVFAYFPALFVPTVFLSLLGMSILLLFLYLFPNGRLYPRWGWLPILFSLLAFTTFNLDFMGLIAIPAWAVTVNILAIFVLFTLAGGFQIVRYCHHSTPVERQQTRWIVLGIFIFLFTFPVWILSFGEVANIAPGMPRLLATIGGWLGSMFGISALPVTMAIAILRYRLWDIDIIIRRTLQYALLTGLLALVYFGLVISFQGVFSTISNQQSEIFIVLSTLAIAALFNPLRRRVQDFIDRRFYRKKYNAEQALAQFAAVVRDEVDMDRLAVALIGVVEETVQPERVSIWLVREDKK